MSYVIQTDYICHNLKFDFNGLCCRKSLKIGVEDRHKTTYKENSDSHLQTPHHPPPQKKGDTKHSFLACVQTITKLWFCAMKPVQLKNQHFQIPIQTGTHGHI